jgi:hypothetical protein
LAVRQDLQSSYNLLFVIYHYYLIIKILLGTDLFPDITTILSFELRKYSAEAVSVFEMQELNRIFSSFFERQKKQQGLQ